MKYLIKGITIAGAIFRPSDWSDRLCSVVAHYRPNAQKITNIKNPGYSVYVMPTVIDQIKCVILDTKLNDIEPLAFDFVLNFAQDNHLTIVKDYGSIIVETADSTKYFYDNNQIPVTN